MIPAWLYTWFSIAPKLLAYAGLGTALTYIYFKIFKKEEKKDIWPYITMGGLVGLFILGLILVLKRR